ncbi:hypothetical protein NXX40_05825 [Parabacteroides distasonis]|nr:hypothetical protein [Parabacteroides distasonis]
MKRLDWKQEDLVGLEVPMLGKIWVHSLIIIYNWLVRMYYIQIGLVLLFALTKKAENGGMAKSLPIT